MKKPIFTSEAPAAIGPYSQGMRSGRFLFCSGQIPLDPKSGEIVSGDIATQTRRVWKISEPFYEPKALHSITSLRQPFSSRTSATFRR